MGPLSDPQDFFQSLLSQLLPAIASAASRRMGTIA